MFEVEDLHTYYGESHILHGIGFRIEQGEAVTLLGRNGAGKTTTIRSVMGWVRPQRGSVRFEGTELVGLAPHQVQRLGLGMVPEDRRIFGSLTVLENLTLPRAVDGDGAPESSLEEIFHHFPVLEQKAKLKGSALSGGERQMLAIARVLHSGSRLLLLDEPTQGLAPIIVREIGEIIGRIKALGRTVLLVEQNTRFAMAVADRHYILVQGRIVWEGSTSALEADRDLQIRHLGV